MDFRKNSFEEIKFSGYYNTATYEQNGNILELRIMKNTLTKWFAINIALYLLSRGKGPYYGPGPYIIAPVVRTYYVWTNQKHYWYFSDSPSASFDNDALHQISPNYDNLAYASGGGFGGAIYLTTLDPPSLGPIRMLTLNSVYGYGIQIIGGDIQFHEIVIDNITPSGSYFHTYYSRRIDCYTSGTSLVLDLQSSNVIASIRGSYTFTENYTPKCILTFSGGKAAEYHNYMGPDSNTYQAVTANILTFRPFQGVFAPGDTIFVEWKVIIQI